MTGTISSSKSSSLNLSSLRSTNAASVAALGGKQNTYLVEAIVSEVRPGGDVILDTPHGFMRTTSDLILEAKDKVIVRITEIQNGEQKASIVGKSDGMSKTQSTTTTVIKYANNPESSVDKARPIAGPSVGVFVYLAPNRNILKYGHITPGDKVMVQILSQSENTHGADIVHGEVISNDRGLVTVNSSIGIVNLHMQSDVKAGVKILFHIIDSPNKEQLDRVGNFVSGIMQEVASNMPLLKQILRGIKNIGTPGGYTELLQLVASQHDTATLAKLFHQTGNVPASDVERWIDEEIVEPFEASNKGSKLVTLSQKLGEISSNLEQLKIVQEGAWYILPMLIPGSKEETQLRVKRERSNTIKFTINIYDMVLEGIIELSLVDKSVATLSMKLRGAEKQIPQELADIIAASFADHKISTGLEGAVEFETIP